MSLIEKKRDSELAKTYIRRFGGGSTAEDIWYDEEEIMVKKGDICPQCSKGVMNVSKKGNLYCSNICWENI
jgi:hypothetical protein